jgi:hypothetical protein
MMARSPMPTLVVAFAFYCAQVYSFIAASSSFARASTTSPVRRQGAVTMRLFNPFGTNYDKVCKAAYSTMPLFDAAFLYTRALTKTFVDVWCLSNNAGAGQEGAA